MKLQEGGELFALSTLHAIRPLFSPATLELIGERVRGDRKEKEKGGGDKGRGERGVLRVRTRRVRRRIASRRLPLDLDHPDHPSVCRRGECSACEVERGTRIEGAPCRSSV